MAVAQPRVTAPIDEFSGLPLLIRSFPEVGTPPGERLNPLEPEMDDHHPRFPREVLCRSLGGLATRGMVQTVWRSDHKRFHAAWDPPALPEDEQSQTEGVLWAAAGYIPAEAVDGADIIALTNEQRRAYIGEGLVHFSDLTTIRTHVLQYVTRVGLTPKERRRHIRALRDLQTPFKVDLSCETITLAGSRAMAGMAARFAEAWDAGLLPLSRTRDIGEFVCDLVAINPMNGDMSKKIGRRLLSVLVAATA